MPLPADDDGRVPGLFPPTLLGLWIIASIGLVAVMAIDEFLQTDMYLNIYFYVVPAMGAAWYLARWLKSRKA